jgi:hypothetical protein
MLLEPRKKSTPAETRRRWRWMWRTQPIRAKKKWCSRQRPPRGEVVAENLVALAGSLLTLVVSMLNTV